MSVSLLLLSLPPLKLPYGFKFSLNLWKLPQNVTHLYIQTPPPWNGFWCMNLRYFWFNWNATDLFTQYVYPIHAKSRLIRNKRDKVGEILAGNKKPPQLRRGLMFLLRRVEDLNFCIQVKGWRISNTQSQEENYRMCAINVLCFLDYWFYKLVEYGFRKGQRS